MATIGTAWARLAAGSHRPRRWQLYSLKTIRIKRLTTITSFCH